MVCYTSFTVWGCRHPPTPAPTPAPLVMAAYCHLAILSLYSFTGAGLNLVRSLAPSIVSSYWPASAAYAILGQFAGYTLAALCFSFMYLQPALGPSDFETESTQEL